MCLYTRTMRNNFLLENEEEFSFELPRRIGCKTKQTKDISIGPFSCHINNRRFCIVYSLHLLIFFVGIKYYT